MRQHLSYALVSFLLALTANLYAQIPTSGWKTLDDFSDGNFNATTGGTGNSNTQWQEKLIANTWNVVGGSLVTQNTSNQISTPFTKVCDAWRFTIDPEITTNGQFNRYFFFMTAASDIPSAASGYQVIYDQGNNIDPSNNGVLALRRIDGGVVGKTIVQWNRGLSTSAFTVTVTRKNNTWTLYVGGTDRGSGTDATYNPQQASYQGAWFTQTNVTNNDALDNIEYHEVGFGAYASAPLLATCSADTAFSTTSDGNRSISAKTFTDTTFGAYHKDSLGLIFKGVQLRTFTGDTTQAKACNAYLNYRIYNDDSTVLGNFTNVEIPLLDTCGGVLFTETCDPNDKKWQIASIDSNLTSFPVGNYSIEVFYQITGIFDLPNAVDPTNCADTVIVNNNGNYYKAKFSIVDPKLDTSLTVNPTSCSSPNGEMSITGLVRDSSYTVNYKVDGKDTTRNISTDNTGTLKINGLSAGIYSGFSITDGCTINVPGADTLIAPAKLSLAPSSTPNTVCNGTGGTPGGCTPKGTGLVINEVLVQPTDLSDCPLGGSGQPTCQGVTRREYIELYNPTCDPIDLSCHILSSGSDVSGFSIIFPANTIVQPKSHFVIGGSSASTNAGDIDFAVDLNPTNFCNDKASLMANGDGFLALFNPTGDVIDAIYWTFADNQANKISGDSDFDEVVCTPTLTGCNTSSLVLKDATEIFNSTPNLITYVGRNIEARTFSRIPDGGAWQADVSPSIKDVNCNGGTCDTDGSGGTSTCNGKASVTVAVAGTETYSYEWKDSLGNVIPGDTSALDSLCAGKYTVKITNNLTGCDSTVTVEVIDDIEPIEPLFDSYGPFCQGAQVAQPILPTDSKNTPTSIKGTWSPAGLSTTTAGPNEYIFTPNTGQCADSTKIIVTIQAPFTLEATVVDPTCGNENGSITIKPQPNTATYTYEWSPVSSTPDEKEENLKEGKYSVIVRTGVCDRDTSITLVTSPAIDGTVVSKDPSTCGNAIGTIEVINVNGGSSPFTYSLNSGTPSTNKTFNELKAGFYELEVSDSKGCTYKETIEIKDSGDVVLRIPNVFTPNDVKDNVNDQWKVSTDCVEKFDCKIINRWGNLVYQFTDPDKESWDGTSNGVKVQQGVYFYVIDVTFSDGKTEKHQGNISVIY